MCKCEISISEVKVVFLIQYGGISILDGVYPEMEMKVKRNYEILYTWRPAMRS